MDTATLISGGKMRSDCGDLRVKDNDQTTDLSYWIESGCNTASTVVWTKVPTVAATPAVTTIYANYGNSLLTSQSNGDSTFIFFDDFETGAIDANKWVSGGSVNPYWITDAINFYQGGYASSNADIGDGQYEILVSKGGSNLINVPAGSNAIIDLFWRVSSESGYDYLRYCFDNTDGVTLPTGYCSGVGGLGTAISSISGTLAFAREKTTVSTNILGSGNHRIGFSYNKDGSVSSGSDSGWIDAVKVRKISYSGTSPITELIPDAAVGVTEDHIAPTVSVCLPSTSTCDLATSVGYVNSGQLTAVTPAHASGAVDVKVTNPDGFSGTLANGFTYYTPVADADNSTVDAAPATFEADGTDGSTITVTVRDQMNNPLSGVLVELNDNGNPGDVDYSPTNRRGTTNASGIATFTVTSSVQNTYTLTATADPDGTPLAIVDTAQVTATALIGNADNSTLSANPTSLGTSAGTLTSTITATLKNQNNVNVPGKTVQINQVSGPDTATITPLSPITNASGQATFSVSASVAGTYTFSATDVTDGNILLTQTVTIRFDNPPTGNTANPGSGPVGGGTPVTISGSNFLDGGYRRELYINSSSATDITDQQVQLTIDTQTIIASGRMSADCSNLRIKDTDGTTDLPYWIESGCNTTSTSIWTKIPTLPAKSNKVIYLAYGDPNETVSESSENNVFVQVIAGALNAFWDFDYTGAGAYGVNLPIPDLSGNNAPGTFTGTSYFNYSTIGKFFAGRGFDKGNCAGCASSLGLNMYVASNPAPLRITGPISVESWVWQRTQTNGNSPRIISKVNSCTATGSGYELNIGAPDDPLAPNEPYISLGNGGAYSKVTSSVAVPTGTWTHVAATWDGTTAKIYVNGVETGSGSAVNPADNTTNLRVGTNSSCQDNDLNGYIDEPRVYNRALTPTEVANLAANYGYGSSSHAGNLYIRKFVGSPVTGTDYDGNNVGGNTEMWSYTGIGSEKHVSLTTVSFDGVPATETTFVDSNTITALTPAHAAGAVDVTIANPNNPGNTITNGYTYFTPNPTLVTADTGLTTGGSVVTISGTNFSSDQYLHRRQITVQNNVASTLTEFQVDFNLDTASLVAAGKMRSDCGDLRVKDTDGTTNLPYYIEESTCNTSSTKVWVNIPTLNASATKNIYATYGNPALTSRSNGTRVFDFFDDFTTDNIGKLWQIVNSVGYYMQQTGSTVTYIDTLNSRAVIKGNILGGTTPVESPLITKQYRLKQPMIAELKSQVDNFASSNSNGHGQMGFVYFDPSYIIYPLQGPYFYSSLAPDGPGGSGVISKGGIYQNYQFGSSATGPTFAYTPTINTWYITRWNSASGRTSFFDLNYAERSWHTGASTGFNNYNIAALNSSYASGTRNTELVDWMRVRKSATTLPSTNVGAEQNNATITFGGTAATSITIVDGNTITATTPAHTAGLVDVAVTIDGATTTLTGGYTYVYPPPSFCLVAPCIVPDQGPESGGTTVTISGSDFQTTGTTTVTFGGTPATNVTVVDPSTITATIPAHAVGLVDVTITNPDAQFVTLLNGFTYIETFVDANSTVTSAPASVVADGADTSTVTVNIQGATNNPLAGKTITLAKTSANPGTPTIAAVVCASGIATPGVTNALGDACFDVQSTTAETDTFTATNVTDSNTNLTDTADITFTPGIPNAGTSTFTAAPGTVPSDGINTSTLTATVRDAFDNLVPNANVSVRKTSANPGTPTFNQTTTTTNGSGVATFTVSNTTDGTDTYVASLDDVTQAAGFQEQGIVHVVPGSGGTWTEVVPANDDDGTATVALPFTFSFFGTNYTTAYMCTNGYIQFTDGAGGCSFNTGSFGSGDGVPRAAAYMRDLYRNVATGSRMEYQTTANSIRFHWIVSDCCSGASNHEFEIDLYNDNHLEYHYNDTSESISGVVGVDSGSASAACTDTNFCMRSLLSETVLSLQSTQFVYGTGGAPDITQTADVTYYTTILPPAICGYTQVSGGYQSSYALRSNGTVWAWGSNFGGQLGNGTYDDSNIPVQVSGLTSVTSVAGGDDHALAIRNDGTVWAWGLNTKGQLGDGTNTTSNVPVQVSGLTNIIAIAGGVEHSLAIRNDGTVWAWGSNQYGQLGNGTYDDSNVPVQITSLSNITAISAGDLFSMARRNDGTVWTWGYAFSGLLGNGTNPANSNVPVQATITDVSAISGKDLHALALKNDGTVWAWGANLNGELGDGTNTGSNLPVQTTITNVASIEAAYGHSLAIRTDGTAWAWGKNTRGQLGNAGNTDSNVPVPVSNIIDVANISGGYQHTIALITDGTLWSWGYNLYGQLGDGTNANTNVPGSVQGGQAT